MTIVAEGKLFEPDTRLLQATTGTLLYCGVAANRLTAILFDSM